MDQELIILGVYFVVINVFAFINMGMDKWKAKTGRWRTSEWHLMVPGILGGIVGLLWGMKFFRHKTKKTSFQVPVVGIIILNLVYWAIFYYFYLA